MGAGGFAARAQVAGDQNANKAAQQSGGQIGGKTGGQGRS